MRQSYELQRHPPRAIRRHPDFGKGGYSFLFGVHHHLGMRHPGHQPRGGRSDQGQLPHGMGVGERPLRSPVRSGD